MKGRTAWPPTSIALRRRAIGDRLSRGPLRPDGFNQIPNLLSAPAGRYRSGVACGAVVDSRSLSILDRLLWTRRDALWHVMFREEGTQPATKRGVS